LFSDIRPSLAEEFGHTGTTIKSFMPDLLFRQLNQAFLATVMVLQMLPIQLNAAHDQLRATIRRSLPCWHDSGQSVA
jgi:hypothetical protein